jgi:long-chain acyl-CoA synthetase
LKEFERKKWLPKTIVCGGASIDMQTIQKLNDLGIEVFEVYGLTETTSLLSTNFPGNVEFGTVGKPLKELKIKLSEDGEVLTKGSHVARGYFKSSDFPVDEKGWFHTGDLGEMTSTGYLKLVGRLKNKLRLSKGVDVNPEPIEKELRANDNIDNVILFGRNQAALVALFQVDPAMTTAELLPKINDLVYNYNLKCGLNEAIMAW